MPSPLSERVVPQRVVWNVEHGRMRPSVQSRGVDSECLRYHCCWRGRVHESSNITDLRHRVARSAHAHMRCDWKRLCILLRKDRQHTKGGRFPRLHRRSGCIASSSLIAGVRPNRADSERTHPLLLHPYPLHRPRQEPAGHTRRQQRRRFLPSRPKSCRFLSFPPFASSSPLRLLPPGRRHQRRVEAGPSQPRREVRPSFSPSAQASW